MREEIKKRSILLFFITVSILLIIVTLSLGFQEKFEASTADQDPILKKLENAKALLKDKNYIEAESIAREVLNEIEAIHGPEDQSLVEPLVIIGQILLDTGELAEAKSFFERALAINEDAPDSDSQAVLSSLDKLREVVYKMGDYEEWFGLYERSLSIMEKTLGAEHPDIAPHLVNIGRQLLDMGNYSQGGPYVIRAKEIAENFYGPKSEKMVWYEYNMAIMYRLSGDYERSILHYGRCFEILGEIYGPESTKLDRYLWSLAGMFLEMKDYARAEDYLQRVMKKWDTYYGPDNRDSRITISLYADVLRHKGKIDEAIDYQLHAMKILKENKSPDPEMVNPLRTLAGLYCDKGEGKKGLELIERALAIREKTHGPDNIAMTWVLNDYVENLWSNGQTAEAINNAFRSEMIARNHLRQYFTSASGRQALFYDTTKARSLDMILSMGVQSQGEIKGIGGQAWDAFIRSRALVLDEMMMRNRAVSEAADPEIYALFHALTLARKKLSDLVVRGPSSLGRTENYSELIAKARNEKEEAEQALAEASRIFRDEIIQKRAGFEEIKASLTPGLALVSFARYIHYDLPPTDLKGKSVPFGDLLQGQSYLAFILCAQEEEPVIVPLGKAEEIEPLIFDWGQEAARGIRIPGRSEKEAASAYRAAGENLRKKIWDPIAVHLRETKCVFVVPDGSLHTVNFAALPIGAEKYLIDTEPMIHYLSAERDLISSGKPSARGTGLLALGDPAYDETSLFESVSNEAKPRQTFLSKVSSLLPFKGTRSSSGDFKSLKFTSLPETKKEIKEIAEIWKRSQDYKGEDLVLLGNKANEMSFKMAAPGKQILHLATHGFFLENKSQSALQRSVQQSESEKEKTKELPSTIRENPLLLSGLALAGANHRESSKPEEEDGILTAEEVAALDLSKVDWVILSACDTGVGIIQAGEGVLGLRRAFQIAGAKTLITSLWAIDDEAAQKWMLELYQARFGEELGTAESVRQASLEILQELRKKRESTHPFYWAGFVASGDWR